MYELKGYLFVEDKIIPISEIPVPSYEAAVELLESQGIDKYIITLEGSED